MSDFIPNPEQERALNSPAPLLVLAGAGTGKTTVLTRRIAAAIVSGLARPDQVLALTFTDKAAAEMAERLGEVLAGFGRQEAARDVTVATYHSFGGVVIRENLLRLGFDQPPAVMPDPAAWRLLATIFDELSFDVVEISTGSTAMVFGHLLNVFSQCKDHLVGPDDLARYAARLDASDPSQVVADYIGQRRAEVAEVAAAYHRFETAKREKGLIDFGDHLYLPLRLFRAHPGLRDAYRRRFPYIFVDEYQDTNHAQRELLLELIDPSRPEITVIGDDDQAIYRWRGAVVQNILRFHEEAIFAPGQVTLQPMTENRRSLPPILDLANLAISQVRSRHAKELHYQEEKRRQKAIVGHYLAASDRQEAEWIAAKIKALEPGARQIVGKKRGFGAVAILCRKRSLFEPIGRALDDLRLPFELIGGTGFYGRWEIRDILSYLLLLADPADDLALARILCSRRWQLASRELFHLGQWAYRQNGARGRHGQGRPKEARLNLVDAVLSQEEVGGLSETARARLATLRDELRGYMQERQRLSLGELATHIIEQTGYRRELRAQTGFDARVALLNLEKLEHMAREFAESPEGGSLGDFVEYVRYALESGDEEGELRPIDEETNTVKVMTIHQAKGLEFPIVFIPGLADRTFPDLKGGDLDKWYEVPRELRGDRDHLPPLELAAVRTKADLDRALQRRKDAEKQLRLDEEWRLFYVAITRAQEQLYFSRAHWYGMTKNPKEASPFWSLVPDSGFSRNEGDQACPSDNPNLVARAGEVEQSEELAAGAPTKAEALLLSEAAASHANEHRAGEDGQELWAITRAEVDGHILALAAGPAMPEAPEKVEVSCSALLLYLRCPRHYRFLYVDRFPTRPSPTARIGREVHEQIEQLSQPVELGAGRVEPEAPDEAESEVAGPRLEDFFEAAGKDAGNAPRSQVPVAGLVATFRESVYGRRPATFVEVPFRLPLESGAVVGRIDRLDTLPDGRWDVVDFKSGAFSPEAAANYRRQLALYALAVRELWRVPAGQIVAHLFLLQDGNDLSFTFDERGARPCAGRGRCGAGGDRGGAVSGD